MPELPEVESLVLGLREHLFGQRLQRVQVLCDRLLGHAVSAAAEGASGGRLVGLSRKGKFLLFHLSNGTRMVFHLRMTGKLLVVPQDRPHGPSDRLRLDFQECGLAFEDQRRFGSLAVLAGSGDDARVPLLGELGPDALQIPLEGFREILKGSRRPVKALLLDQRNIAGLGNIYVDECLHRAKIHPRTPANRVPGEKVRALHGAMRAILRRAITLGGSSVRTHRDLRDAPGSYQRHHRVYKREGQPCPCGKGTIRYIKVASRGTRYCPSCQKDRPARRHT